MKELLDMQNERDTRQIAIDRVGVRDVKFPIVVRDKKHRTQSTVATVALMVDLPSEFKGTHMSRFVEALHEHRHYLDVHTAVGLPARLLEKFHAQCAHVDLEFPFFLVKKAPVTGFEGMMDYGVRFQIDAKQGVPTVFTLTLKVPVTTLCPCSKSMSDKGAHNQRGIVTYSVRFRDSAVWIEDLIAMIESCASCPVYSLLKRPDEKYVTDAAYDKPVFVEDLVRNVAMATEAHDAFSWYRVEAENFESIHNHNAYALIERDLSGDGAQ
ncbi:MAG: GTP cyclohydrolase FolE2 [Akkermansia sp.]